MSTLDNQYLLERRFLPEFNCFMRRLIHLNGGLPEVYVRQEYMDSCLISPGERPRVLMLGDTPWDIGFDRGSFPIRVRRDIRGKVWVEGIGTEFWLTELPDPLEGVQ